jgi:hypothetical protein
MGGGDFVMVEQVSLLHYLPTNDMFYKNIIYRQIFQMNWVQKTNE